MKINGFCGKRDDIPTVKSIVYAYFRTMWKGITQGWLHFQKRHKLILGDRCSLSSLHDVWLGDSPLSRRFPEIFTLVSNKHSWIADYIHRNESGLYCDLLLGGIFLIGRLMCIGNL